MAVISFDFDDCIYVTTWELVGERWVGQSGPNHSLINKMRRYAAEGHEIVITTYRNSRHENEEWIMQWMPERMLIEEFVRRHNLPVKKVHYTNHEPKGPVLKRIGCVLHFDDDLDVIYDCEEHGVKAVWITLVTTL